MVRPGFKQTEVGEIPEDWEVKSIGDFSPFITSGSRGWASYYSEYGASFVRITNMNRDSIYLDMTDSKYVALPNNSTEGKRTELKNGDTLISITADIGICSYVDDTLNKPAYINQHVALVRFLDRTLCSKYVSYFLASNNVQKLFKSSADQGAKTGMNLNSVRSIKFAVPQETEQNSIAKVLSDADELIVSLEKLIAKKRDIKTSTMQQLLTGKKRLPGFGEGKGTKQTELGKIPEDWDCYDVPNLTKATPNSIKIGPFGSALKKEYLTKSGYKVYGQENVYDKDITLGGRYLPLDHYLKLQSCKIEPGDFLLSMMGTVGKCLIVPKFFEPGIIDSHLIRIRFDPNIVSSDYLIQLFQSKLIENQIKKLSVGGIMEGLSSKIIKLLQIPIGNIEEQKAISKILTDMDLEITCLTARLDKAKAIKQGMMQELLTGRTRLIDAPETAIEDERMHGT